MFRERDRSIQEELASQSRRLSDGRREIDTLKAHQLSLTATLDSERKRDRDEMEKVSDDLAMMRSERDHRKAQSEMREIEVKRMKKQDTSPGGKGKDTANSILHQSGGKENNALTDRVDETPPTAAKMTPRQCKPSLHIPASRCVAEISVPMIVS